MNKQRLEEEIKKRRTSPYFSSTYKERGLDWQKEAEIMSSKLIASWGKDIPKKCCSDPRKYKNGIGGLKFWSCKNCGADLGDVND